MRPCAVCALPVDPDEAHWDHEADCTARLCGDVFECRCDIECHPWCCTNPGCQVIPKIEGQADLFGDAA